MNRMSSLAGVLALSALGSLGGPFSPVPSTMKREPQPPAKPTSNRKALLLEAALRRKARWER